MQEAAVSPERLSSLIKEARDAKGLNQQEAAARAGVKYRTYGAYERGEIKNPSMEKVQSIATALHIEEFSQAMQIGDGASAVAERSGAAADQPPQTVEKQAAVVRNAPEEVRSVFERTRTLTVYTEAKADCGEGRVIFEDGSKIEVTIPTTLFERLMGVRLPSVIGAMFCTGDSMEPVFEEEDLLFYHPTREIDGAGNYAVMVDERLMAKRIQPLPGRGVRLISENKRAGYQDFDLVPPKGDEANGLIFEKTNQQVDFWPAGRIFWPRRETSRMHISQVKELIGSLMETGGGQRVA